MKYIPAEETSYSGIMAKFTIFYKNKAIKYHVFNAGVIYIGREKSNDLIINDDDIASIHAVITIEDNIYTIEQINNKYPLIINTEQTAETELQHNDEITVGQHKIAFIVGDFMLPPSFNQPSNQINHSLSNASLQVLTGKQIGQVLSLKKPITRLGKSDTGIIMISKQKKGYFISSLKGDTQTTINQEPLADKTISLNDNDMVIIDNVSMQFFLEK